MLVKHIIKTLHVSVTIVWPSSGGHLSCLVLLLVLVLALSTKDDPLKMVKQLVNCLQTSTSGTHTQRQHTATYQINNLTTQTGREVSNSTKHERWPLEDGQTIVTETCRVLIMCFTNIFNNLEF